MAGHGCVNARAAAAAIPSALVDLNANPSAQAVIAAAVNAKLVAIAYDAFLDFGVSDSVDFVDTLAFCSSGAVPSIHAWALARNAR